MYCLCVGFGIAAVWLLIGRQRDKSPIDRAKTYSYKLKNAFDHPQITEIAKKKGVTVDIVVRIGTGEKVTVYSGTFTQ